MFLYFVIPLYNAGRYISSCLDSIFTITKEFRTVINKYREMDLHPVQKIGRKNPYRFLMLVNRPWLLYPVVAVRNFFAKIIAPFKNKV